MKKYLLTAGYKMFLSVTEGIEYARRLKEYVNSIEDLNKRLKLVIFTDFLSLYSVAKIFGGTRLEVGTSDVFWEDRGAYTGEISPLFLSEIGCNYVLLGHPERITNLKENSGMINKKVIASLRNNITPFLIISEKKDTSKEKVLTQVRNNFQKYTEGLDVEKLKKIVIIYEPWWAINVQSAPADYIAGMVSDLRNFLNNEYGSKLGDIMYIYYGGGVKNFDSFESLIEVKELDGVGLGKYSVDYDFFTTCINMVNNKLNKEQSIKDNSIKDKQ